MNKKSYGFIAIIGLLAVVLTAGYSFARTNSFDGSIQGANCTVNKTVCPVDSKDSRVMLENDFVLLQSDGKYLFLPNIKRYVKTRLIGEDVRVTGSLKGERLFVSKIYINDNGSFRTVWDHEVERKKLFDGFR